MAGKKTHTRNRAAERGRSRRSEGNQGTRAAIRLGSEKKQKPMPRLMTGRKKKVCEKSSEKWDKTPKNRVTNPI